MVTNWTWAHKWASFNGTCDRYYPVPNFFKMIKFHSEGSYFEPSSSKNYMIVNRFHLTDFQILMFSAKLLLHLLLIPKMMARQPYSPIMHKPVVNRYHHSRVRK
ncbi:hypothetical protein AMECASPLE_011762 [Ameca splendens]|uniref:Uncharacterized protein n=1 Tax=Ameca splendens TaxID=208324 RepID=A0ABV0XE07_9TELE